MNSEVKVVNENGSGQELSCIQDTQMLDQIKSNAARILSEAQELAKNIKDEASKLLAQAMFFDMATKEKIANAYLDEHSRKVMRAAKAANASEEAILLKPYEEGRKVLKLALADYDRECERRYMLEQAEATRKQAEANKKAADKAALNLIKAGDVLGAQAAIEKVKTEPPAQAIIQKETNNENVIYVTRWAGEIVSLMEIIKSIAKGDAPIEILFGQEVKACSHLASNVNHFAAAHKGTKKVPGVKFTSWKEPRPRNTRTDMGDAA